MRNNVFWRIMPLFLLMTFMSSGCSKDEEVNPVEEVDGIVMDRNGTLVVVSEVKDYPDSIGVKRRIPCKPIGRENIPQWLFEELMSVAIYDNTILILGDLKDNSGQVCYFYRLLCSWPYEHVYRYGETKEVYEVKLGEEKEFLDSAINWRCIYMTTVRPFNSNYYNS